MDDGIILLLETKVRPNHTNANRSRCPKDTLREEFRTVFQDSQQSLPARVDKLRERYGVGKSWFVGWVEFKRDMFERFKAFVAQQRDTLVPEKQGEDAFVSGLQPVVLDIEEDDLSQGAGAPSAGDAERAGALEQVRSQQEEAGAFAPSNLEDARKRILVAIVWRQGQQAFREQLLAAYGHSCAVTDCDVAEALEAAHIVAYLGPETNHVTNGLLLRADIHTLFDLGLLAVHPQEYRLIISRRLRGTAYASLEGRRMHLPPNQAEYPSREALEVHMTAFRSKESENGQA